MLIRTIFLSLLLITTPVYPDEIHIAAAADLRFVMDKIIRLFKAQHPNDRIEISYGSSGKFHSQIQNGAPFDLFFSADIVHPNSLVEAGLGSGKVHTYAIGRIVLWRLGVDSQPLALSELSSRDFSRIAIANPKHAPYGIRATEALKAAKVWTNVERRLVFGENVAQAALFVQTRNADIGIIALSLAMTPELSSTGNYSLIPAEMHSPLEQGYIILKRAENNPLAKKFADFFNDSKVHSLMRLNGFSIPNTSTR
jgi:molybdate transport system substrate-binding protein